MAIREYLMKTVQDDAPRWRAGSRVPRGAQSPDSAPPAFRELREGGQAGPAAIAAETFGHLAVVTRRARRICPLNQEGKSCHRFLER